MIAYYAHLASVRFEHSVSGITYDRFYIYTLLNVSLLSYIYIYIYIYTYIYIYILYIYIYIYYIYVYIYIHSLLCVCQALCHEPNSVLINVFMLFG